MLAYFIGGPMDLTKTVTLDAPPVIRVPQMRRGTIATYHHWADDPSASLGCDVHTYRRTTQACVPGTDKVWIYLWEGR